MAKGKIGEIKTGCDGVCWWLYERGNPDVVVGRKDTINGLIKAGMTTKNPHFLRGELPEETILRYSI